MVAFWRKAGGLSRYGLVPTGLSHSFVVFNLEACWFFCFDLLLMHILVHAYMFLQSTNVEKLFRKLKVCPQQSHSISATGLQHSTSCGAALTPSSVAPCGAARSLNEALYPVHTVEPSVGCVVVRVSVCPTFGPQLSPSDNFPYANPDPTSESPSDGPAACRPTFMQSDFQ
jgi:hypothetical protein